MQALLLFLSLMGQSLSAVTIQQTISFPNSDDEVTPQWKSRDSLQLVPLAGNVRQGYVDPVTEEGIIQGLGPYLANAILANSTKDGLGSCLSCASTVLKEIPCIIKAIATENPLALLGCGVGKADICKCVPCLPAKLQKYPQQWCDSKEEDLLMNVTDHNPQAYVDFSLVAEHDMNLAAFRGDLAKFRLEEVKKLGYCPGRPCGRNPCCVGLCLPKSDTCIGAVVEL